MAKSGELYGDLRNKTLNYSKISHVDCFASDIASLTDGVIVIINNKTCQSST